MKLRNLVCLAGILVLLSACGGAFVEDHFVADGALADPEAAGYLVGSIGYYTGEENKFAATSSSVRFRRVGSEGSGSIVAKPGVFKSGDYEETDRIGKVFALPLKPGAYEFYNIDFWFYYGMGGSKTYSAREDFSIPFTIEANKAYYAGEFLAFGTYGKNIFGITIPAGGFFAHLNNFERDGPMLRAKYPDLDGKLIEPLDVKLTVPPFIVPLPE